ncbi:uncharacterized protein LOC134227958 [Armigeres subalbatus]|uniref:uncharacterized protein LOC134227958 n=1 Tax=Armigeres subalbatus TaxID=124917 RepID=UPI002ED3291A
MDRCEENKRNGKRTYAAIAWGFIQKEENRFKCRIDIYGTCHYSQETYDVGNFIRHFRTVHPEAAFKNGLTKELEPVSKKRIIAKRLVAIDAQQYIGGCLKLTTDHHLPLRCFEWEGLKMLLDPISEALGVCVNRRNIKTLLATGSAGLKNTIKAEMAGILFCLRIDSASLHGRHILGIDAQFSIGNEIVTRTLGMIEVKSSQTAIFLKTKVLEVLKRYDLSLEQVLSITSDNGKNMIAAGKQLQLLYAQTAMKDMFDHGEQSEEFDEKEEELLENITQELSEQFNIIR